jgi:hypothetical protein
MRLAALLLVLVFACNQAKNVDKPVERKIAIYPEELSAMPSVWLEERIIQSKLFNLPLLFKRSEEFELRIIPWQASWLRFGQGRDIFVFKRDSIGWTGFHYYSYSARVFDLDGISTYINDTAKFGLNTFVVKKLMPLCGWSKFADSIHYFQIETLPTEDLIKGFARRFLLDGYGYEFEISSPGSYRFLSYNNPSSYNYFECRRVDAFMNMIRRQTGSDYCWPECRADDN